MKKILFIIVAIIGVSTQVSAQNIADHAIGVRFGDSSGFGAEANYQLGLSEKNRLEFGLGIRDGSRNESIKAIGLYQWVWNIDGGLNWYAGPGAGIEFVNFDDDYYDDRDSKAYAIIAGDVGLEYNFDFPLLISIDFRPEIGFEDYDDDDIRFNVGLSARYQF